MRIISGKYKGRRIPVRKNFPSRPTTDFAKENLFNILNNHFDFEDLRVLDLFAGTGSISYEFASRGSVVTCVELNFKSHRFIQETVRELELTNIRAVRADVFKYIEKETAGYDLIFADPPYEMHGLEKIPDAILGKEILNKDCWLILEHSDQKKFSGHPKLIDTRCYGSVNFSIFTR
ncbi:MAG: RsmD family RNA methyltransferase [Bacteroidales bacterium]|nr:RsmD family RNA methyltransferase [Bacteroidales bacterium]